MIVTRPTGSETNDLLDGHEFKDLMVFNLEGELVARQNPPYDGWCHDSLEALSIDDMSPNGWNAYLGDKDYWVGSSEV